MFILEWLKPAANYGYDESPAGKPAGTTAIVEPGKVTYFSAEQGPEQWAYLKELESERAKAAWLRLLAVVLLLTAAWVAYKKK